MTTSTLSCNKDLYTALAQGRQTLLNLAMITVGSCVFVYGMNAVMIPAHLFSGGLTGLAILFSYYHAGVDVGALYFLLNIPLIILGWLAVGKRFIAYSLYGIMAFSLAASWLNPPALILNDPLLAALVGGVICGIGSGLILKSCGSAGGLDILAVFLNRHFGTRVGTTCFVANTMVLLLGFYCYDTTSALYSIILLYVSSCLINKVIAGFNPRVAVTIISNSAQEICRQIISETGRGVTFLDGRGGYTCNPKQVILTITAIRDLPKLKTLISGTDPQAFVIVNNTQDVFGQGYSSLQTH
jgi:uncharacterized membrane-anchored protein YitT (DUF2179 family)